MNRKVLVISEIRGGALRNVSLEALSAARLVAEGGEVATVVFGSTAAQQAAVLAQHGADRVYVASNPQFDQYTADAYAQGIHAAIEAFGPDVIFAGHTGIGKDVAPRVAGRLGLGLVSDVTAIALEDGEIIFTRPIYAGKAFQTKKFRGGTVFATIRPNNIATLQPDASREAVVTELAVEVRELRAVVKDVVRKTAGKIDLTEAKIIVSGGRGVKSADGFQVLQALADVLGAAIGASRGACDAGYADYSLQIGQTGKVVTPELYIACGISGAIQHLAGMSNSRVIVAINKDPEAPIFQVCDYGIVGDLFEVVPLLTSAIRELLNEK
jgi:electron transfer flavoprotein alpha subunit